MNVIDEIEALKKIVQILAPLDEASRQRVLAYAASAFADKPLTQEVKSTSPRSGSGATEQGKELPGGKPVSPQEYLRKYNYNVMTKRIGVMAVYLEREKQMKRFGFKAITETFRDAKEHKVPAQSQYGRAVIMGYLAKEGDQYYATTQAEKLVDGYTQNGCDQPSD